MKYLAFVAAVFLGITEGIAAKKQTQRMGLETKCFVPGKMFGNPDGDFLTDLAILESFYAYPMLPAKLNYYTSRQTGKLMGLQLDLTLRAEKEFEGEVIGTSKSDRGTTIVTNQYDLQRNPFDAIEFVFDSNTKQLCNVGFWLENTKNWLLMPNRTQSSCNENSGNLAYVQNSLDFPIVGLHGFTQYEGISGIGPIYLRQDLAECKVNSQRLHEIAPNEDPLEEELRVSQQTLSYGARLEQMMLKTFHEKHADQIKAIEKYTGFTVRQHLSEKDLKKQGEIDMDQLDLETAIGYMLRMEGKDMEGMSEDELAAWILRKSMGDQKMSNFEEAEIYQILQHFAEKRKNREESKPADQVSSYELYQQFKES